VRIRWTGSVSSDLRRVHERLRLAAADLAVRLVQQLARAPDRLLEYSRIGEKLDACAPREVRRIIVGSYELRYEIADATIFILRIWHCREGRSRGTEG